jgi:hypothetical protein
MNTTNIARSCSRRCSALLALAALTAACGGYSKETVSLYRDHVGMRVPNQQRLLALSTDEAVARLDFKGLAGKKVVVEMSGIFPHTRADVLDYIQGQVEGKIARDGGLVISAGQLVVADGEGSNAPTSTISLTPSDADYRVVIGVSWAGVDTHDRKTINGPLLSRQIGLMAGGVAGILLGACCIDDTTVAPMLMGLGGLALAGGFIWNAIQKPQLHIYRLLGRVRVSVNAVPVLPGNTAFQTVGEGQTELVVDPLAEEGYILVQ